MDRPLVEQTETYRQVGSRKILKDALKNALREILEEIFGEYVEGTPQLVDEMNVILISETHKLLRCCISVQAIMAVVGALVSVAGHLFAGQLARASASAPNSNPNALSATLFAGQAIGDVALKAWIFSEGVKFCYWDHQIRKQRSACSHRGTAFLVVLLSIAAAVIPMCSFVLEKHRTTLDFLEAATKASYNFWEGLYCYGWLLCKLKELAGKIGSNPQNSPTPQTIATKMDVLARDLNYLTEPRGSTGLNLLKNVDEKEVPELSKQSSCLNSAKLAFGIALSALCVLRTGWITIRARDFSSIWIATVALTIIPNATLRGVASYRALEAFIESFSFTCKEYQPSVTRQIFGKALGISMIPIVVLAIIGGVSAALSDYQNSYVSPTPTTNSSYDGEVQEGAVDPFAMLSAAPVGLSMILLYTFALTQWAEASFRCVQGSCRRNSHPKDTGAIRLSSSLLSISSRIKTVTPGEFEAALDYCKRNEYQKIDLLPTDISMVSGM